MKAIPTTSNHIKNVSWPATTQPTALKFGVNLVSKTG